MIKKIVIIAMSFMLGIVSVRAQEIPDTAALADTLRAACDTSKIKSELQGVSALADSLRAACDTSKIKAGLQGMAEKADTILTVIEAAAAEGAARLQKDDVKATAKQDKDKAARTETTAKQDKDKAAKTETTAKQNKNKAAKNETVTKQDKDKVAKTETAAKQDKDQAVKNETSAKQDKDKAAKNETVVKQDKDKAANTETAAKQDKDKAANTETVVKQDKDKAANTETAAKQGKDLTAKDLVEKDDEQKQKAERSDVNHAGKFFIMLQGGAAFNYYENSFMYQENNQVGKMFTPQGALSVGMDFSETIGTRLQLAYGTDAGACNNRETSNRGFYTYTFKHVNAFVDAMLNLGAMDGKGASFRPKFYIGAGLAHTFGFSDPKHPWQVINAPNTVFGFRGGLLAEYCFRSGFGIFADICGEAYTDSYNGLQPSKEDQAKNNGYAGFPLDLRAVASLGIAFHF